MAKHLRIIGRVQGVGYRASFETQALALKLSGWVRNRFDGSVEALVQGNNAELERIIAWARRGPASAQVREVVVTEVDDGTIPEGHFEMLPTQ